jgi:hypothetical protein
LQELINIPTIKGEPSIIEFLLLVDEVVKSHVGDACLEVFASLAGVVVVLEVVAPGSFVGRNCLIQLAH